MYIIFTLPSMVAFCVPLLCTTMTEGLLDDSPPLGTDAPPTAVAKLLDCKVARVNGALPLNAPKNAHKKTINSNLQSKEAIHWHYQRHKYLT